MASKPIKSVLGGAELHAIAKGDYVDIFSVLGWHRPKGAGPIIRAFLPWAESVAVYNARTDKKLADLEKVHPDGIFEAQLDAKKRRCSYYFLANDEVRVDDPYRFSSLLDSNDLYLFNEGTAEKSWQWLGANYREMDGVAGVLFAVWAPAAKRVSVVGDFNGWDGRQHVMRKHPASGIWEIFIPAASIYSAYKFEIVDQHGSLLPLKADPYARSMEHPPSTASRVAPPRGHEWQDEKWMASRNDRHLSRPVSVYEVHAGSWRRKADEGNRYLSYRELADELIPYVQEMGFTHIQFMPLSEFPFDGSWGYQPLGMYAPSIRFGTPDELRYLVDKCHQSGIGVLLDWVPGHFPTDVHGLGRFDGTSLYEHEDRRQGFHPDWNTLIYNYSRPEVVSYLISNANYWLQEYHIDGLRVDAVASMLYLDYSREEGQWIANQYGGRENLAAIDFLKSVNSRVYFNNPGIMMVAEESTAWPGVSRPVDAGGLGFGFKWNMGWMNDTLCYMERDPVHRQYHHDEMTFSIVYAWDENFMLSISHDEVVHGKRSLLEKMPGDDWQKFANLRAYYGFMWGHPGKKLLFMGCEFGQRAEWNHDSSLDWHLLGYENHRGLRKLVADLNGFYRNSPALYSLDSSPQGFRWLQINSRQNSIFAWARFGEQSGDIVVVVCNMTPQTHQAYRVGVPRPGWYKECINTDASHYGGSGQGNFGGVNSQDAAHDDMPCSIEITVPPLSALMFSWQQAGE